MLLTLLGVGFIAVIIYIANEQNAGRFQEAPLSQMLYLLLFMQLFIAINLLLATLTPEILTSTPELAGLANVPPLLIVAFLGMTIAASALQIAVIRSRAVRVWIRDTLIETQYVPQGSNVHIGFNVDSPVHKTAFVLMIFLITVTIGQFLQVGGIEGVAASIDGGGSALATLMVNMLLYILIALLGIGLFNRRTIAQSLDRLGLQRPARTNLLPGIRAGIALFILQLGFSLMLSIFLDADALAQQSAAAEQLFAAFSTSILLGFLLALSTGIGEEILFRGALQPVFGIWLTSLFFTFLHMQYILTPAALFIFVVSVSFGWVRNRHGTTAAIIAHIVYNFLPFLLVWAGAQMSIPENAFFVLLYV